MCMCASGKWKVKFEKSSEKRFFQKLNGDLVKVPVLYNDQYKAVMTYVVNLKAQVMNSQHPALTWNIHRGHCTCC